MKHRRKKAPDAVIAIDLGRRSIKAILMRRNRSGITIEGHQLIQVTDENQASTDLLELALATLDETLLRKTRNITVGIGGHECRITLRELPAADPCDLRKVIRRAPAQIFKENFDNLAFDCSSLGAPLKGIQKRMTLITAIPRDKSETLEKIAARHGCKLCALTVSQISAMEAVAAVHGGLEKSIGILDIGSQTSTLTIVQNGEMAFVRASFETSSAPTGGDLLSQETREKQLSASIAALAVELRSSFDYFEQNQGAHPAIIYVTGAAGSNRRILDLLQQEIGIEIQPFDSVPEVRIKTSVEEADCIKRNFTQFVSAVTEGDRLLKANAGLDLLAEQREVDLKRNEKPLRNVFAVCAALVAGVIGWGVYQQVRTGQLETELNSTQNATRKLTDKAELAMITVAQVTETKETLDSIAAQANARFFYAPVLGALQDVSFANVELTKLKIQEDIVQTAVSRGYTNRSKKLIAAQPARVIRRNTVVLEAKQSVATPVEILLASIKEQDWFKTSLRPVDPVLLKELITQNVGGTKDLMLKVEAYAEKELQ